MGWKMPVVLSCMFCLMINCLSACFDRISALSAGCGCGIRPVRGTRNFGRQNILSGNRCKFTSMFICTSLARPCASVACCRTKFQVPLTALLRHPHFGGRYRQTVKHWKDGFYRQKQNMQLRTTVFYIQNKYPLDNRIILTRIIQCQSATFIKVIVA